jgi:hypothetical protein
MGEQEQPDQTQLRWKICSLTDYRYKSAQHQLMCIDASMPETETEQVIVPVVYGTPEPRNVISRKDDCTRSDKELPWRAAVCINGKSWTLTDGTYLHLHIYDTIHQAPTRMATRTISVKILAPALSPAVTESNVMGEFGTLAPASGWLTETPPFSAVAGPPTVG